MNNVADAGLDDEGEGLWVADGIIYNNNDDADDIFPYKDCVHSTDDDGELIIKTEKHELHIYDVLPSIHHFSAHQDYLSTTDQQSIRSPLIKKEIVEKSISESYLPAPHHDHDQSVAAVIPFIKKEFQKESINESQRHQFNDKDNKIPSKVMHVESVKPSTVKPKVFDYEHEIGELVWAKMPGYPAWPALIVMEHKSQTFKKTVSSKKKKKFVLHLHVLFLNYKDQVAWIPASNINKYHFTSSSKHLSKKDSRIKEAVAQANMFVPLSCSDRIDGLVDIQTSQKTQSLYEKYPKLLMKPVIQIQRFKSTLMKSYRQS